MSYSIGILRRAQKELAQIPKQEYERIKGAIEGLSQDPRPQGCKKLTGREGWRIRVGDYRVI
jgi:mRNA interferase RelE/StbE